MSSQFQLCKQHCVLTRKSGMRNPRAFVPQATQYFPASCNVRPCCEEGGMETVSITIASVTQWDTYPGLVYACVPVRGVVCGEHTHRPEDLWERGALGLVSPVSGWSKGAAAGISLQEAWPLFTARRPCLCFPRVRLSSFLFFLHPSWFPRGSPMPRNHRVWG